MDGRRIGGRYRLLERRAIGGMAAVWRGLDERTGREVAVKLLHPHLVADADARRRLRREARATETLEHPNVVSVRAVVADRDAPAVVMDYVEGRSLAERLAEDGPLPEDQALAIARDVAAALSAAHDRGIVHRDVKPGNVLLTPEGPALLGDFGIATDPGGDRTSLTGEHGVIGTLRYMAPERLLGEPALPATDVWGVGAILYEMLAGRPAFEGSGGVLDADRTLPPRPDGIGDATWRVIERALAADPGDRYPDGRALAAALGAVVIGDPIAFDAAETTVVPLRAGAPTPQPRAEGGRADRRRSFVAVAALGLGALLLGGALIGLGGAGESTADADRSPAPTVAPSPTEMPAAADEVDDAGADEAGGEGASGGEGGDAGRPEKPDKPVKDRGDDRGRGNGEGRDHGNGGD
jgi:hypothetical protein